MGITHNQKWLIFFIVGMLMFGISFYSHQREKKLLYEVSGKEENILKESEKEINEENTNDIMNEFPLESSVVMVHVEGAVITPGLYELEEESRVADAIKAAGGMTEKADRQGINLAMKLQDGIQIYIPEKGEISDGAVAGRVLPSNNHGVKTIDTSNHLAGKININQANQGELTQLQGIGDALAGRIIEYRQQQGPFKTIEDIKNVSGIGDKKFQQIKDRIITN